MLSEMFDLHFSFLFSIIYAQSNFLNMLSLIGYIEAEIQRFSARWYIVLQKIVPTLSYLVPTTMISTLGSSDSSTNFYQDFHLRTSPLWILNWTLTRSSRSSGYCRLRSPWCGSSDKSRKPSSCSTIEQTSRPESTYFAILG